ncbi:hypothetical protein AYJ02_12160 [Shewanella algae]|nr:hypothetical protein AYJ02_12160 [Shewanella algae]
MLEQNLVDGVYGLCNTHGVSYEGRIISSAAKIVANAGSKYCPSPTLLRAEEIEEYQGRLAIVAKPCEINAIKSMLECKGKKDEHFYISFFCAGLPNYSGTLTLVNDLGGHISSTEDILSVNYRGGGWPGKFIAKTMTGTYEASYEKSWGEYLNQTLPLICKICPDGIGMSADIVCADYWETDKSGYPVFDDKPGKSLLIVRTENGKRVADKVIENNDIGVMPLGIDLESSLEKVQPLQSTRRSTFKYRRIALNLKGISSPQLKGFSYGGTIGLKEKLRAFVGMYLRVDKHVKN